MPADPANDLLRRGRHALVAADWQRARWCFEQAHQLGETAEVLDGLSEVAHFKGEHHDASERRSAPSPPTVVMTTERRLPRWRAGWRSSTAASTATEPPRTAGWRGPSACWTGSRSRSSLGVSRSTVLRGRYDPAERERHATHALAIARRFGDRDLEFSAQAVMGHAYVVARRVGEGMSLIDEAMAAVSGAEVVGVDAIGSI